MRHFLDPVISNTNTHFKCKLPLHIAAEIKGSLREKLLPFALLLSYLTGKLIYPVTAADAVAFLWISEPSLFGLPSGTEDKRSVSGHPLGFQHQLET